MRVCVLAIALVALSAGQEFSFAQSAAPPATALPIRRVVLYKTGVGYFEHQGLIRGNQSITIRFTSSQLNDVLKSLTTIDPRGRISGISYNSMAPIDRRLGALRLPLGPAGTAFDLLGSLRGARVEVAAKGTPVQGRLLGVERKVLNVGEREYEVQEFSIITAGGTVRSFELTPATNVRVLDPEMRQEVGRYLDVIGSAREQDVRNVVISSAGTGERPLYVSYVSEVPIWKSTYRLVVPSSGAPFIQGWAVIDNTIGEDWRGVELSLVAGAPQSFIQQLSQPFYRERPVLPLPIEVLTEPQTHQAGLSSGEAPLDLRRRIRRDGDAVAAEPAVPGGVVGGVVGGIAAGVAGGLPSAQVEALRDIEPAAQASDLGDLFEYRLKEPVTLHKNQSALVPIINAAIDVEKVSIWNKGAVSGHPLRALWLTNTTGRTLDGGSVTVLDGGAFAGDALIESLAPNAKRLISDGDDLAVIVTGSLKNGPARISRLRAAEGVMVRESEDRATWAYAIRNEADTLATLLLEHALRPGWTLAEGQTVAEVAPGAPRFRISLAPHEEKTFTVREIKRTETRAQVATISEIELIHLTQNGFPSDALRAAMQPILAKKAEVVALERTLADLNSQEARISSDQQRLRENMKALRGSSEEKRLLQRYARQLDDQETELDTLRQSIAAAQARTAAARVQLADAIKALKFDL